MFLKSRNYHCCPYLSGALLGLQCFFRPQSKAGPAVFLQTSVQGWASSVSSDFSPRLGLQCFFRPQIKAGPAVFLQTSVQGWACSVSSDFSPIVQN